jgi:uncharacterized protein YgbK (DUF1537 family)
MPLLGVIADDFTGATDIANTLVKGGMRTVQTIGVPAPAMDLSSVDAVVVALKSRSIEPAEAVKLSLAALEALQRAGCQRFFFKYCSTFDSTDRGNIGPVADALLQALGTDRTIFCPAFPENGRAIYNGYLFVGPMLLSESSMKDHPLTPMTDPSLVRTLQRQTRHKVGLVPLKQVQAGAEAMWRTLDALAAEGTPYAIVDAVSDHDLMTIGEACAELPLITGGSGVALGLPAAWHRRGLLAQPGDAARLSVPAGAEAVIAGSCSAATNGQVAAFARDGAVFRLDPEALLAGRDVVGEALGWAKGQLGKGPVLIASTAAPETVRSVQQKHGVEESSRRIEAALAAIARGLVDAGVRRLVVAGGETAGAVVNALGVEALRIGGEIDPGVPWTETMGGQKLALALKSGNFGAPDFFRKAFERLG